MISPETYNGTIVKRNLDALNVKTNFEQLKSCRGNKGSISLNVQQKILSTFTHYHSSYMYNISLFSHAMNEGLRLVI